MAGPARYEWQHYIPHRKNDLINGVLIPRSKRRVSFTFRQVHIVMSLQVYCLEFQTSTTLSLPDLQDNDCSVHIGIIPLGFVLVTAV